MDDDKKEEEALYELRANGEDPDCDTVDLSEDLVVDVKPTTPPVPCDDPVDEPEEPFFPPNVPPDPPVDPDLLPDAITIYSRATSLSCAVGQSALSGVDPTVIGAGYDVQLVYIDAAEEIPQNELFRLAGHIEALQELTDSDLTGAIDGDTLDEFDAAIVALTQTTEFIATKIRERLVAAQTTADLIAVSAAQAQLTCGWLNREMWVICDEADPGYEVLYTDPEADEFVHVPAGEFESLISQQDADDLAARRVAFRLECLVGNDKQDVTCSDIAGGIDETTQVTWPTSWTIAPTPSEGNPLPTVVVPTTLDWSTITTAVADRPLSELNGQQFVTISEVGDSESTTLRTRVIIAANDPRAFARTKPEADELARNIALQELNCFFPNRPLKVSCMTPDIGSDSVIARAAAVGHIDNAAGRDSMYEEMEGGSQATFGGPVYDRLNVGIEYPSAILDTSQAFEVQIWPGMFYGVTEEIAEDTAHGYGSGYLLCNWISPEHKCLCVDDPDNSGEAAEIAAGVRSAKFDYVDEVEPNDAVLNTDLSSPQVGDTIENELERGQFISDVFPNGTIGAAIVWPDLAAFCQAGLSCTFEACKVVFCEPRADDRAQKVNGMPNYATWNQVIPYVPATEADHVAFIARWITERNRALLTLSSLCADFPLPPHNCNVTPSDNGDIFDQGPTKGGAEDYGMPARFKYGGVLKLNHRWVQTTTDLGGEVPIPGGTLPCSEINNAPEGEDPYTIDLEVDPWGIFSGAEGSAQAQTPIGLSEIAVMDAKSRLDCTHLSWPRHIVNCRQANQKSFGPPEFTSDIAIEGASTMEADESIEAMLYQVLECNDPGNFAITLDRGGGGGGGGGAGKVVMQSPSIAKTGTDDCMEAGLHEADIVDEDCSSIGSTVLRDLPLPNGVSHIFIVMICCKQDIDSDQEVKKPSLRIVADGGGLGYRDIIDAQQGGEFGVQEGRDAANTLREVEDGEVWYIASVYWSSSFKSNSVMVQAHSGPIIIGESCCGGSSSGSGSSRQGSSASGGSSRGGSSAGSKGSSTGSKGSSTGGSVGSGSAKSNAIVPMPWHDEEFGALATIEALEVLFDFVMRHVPITGRVTEIPLDGHWRFLCEPYSLIITGYSAKGVGLVSFDVVQRGDEEIIVITTPWFKFLRPTSVHMRVTGVRDGFANYYGPPRTLLQFEKNEEFLNSAYPKGEE